MLYNKKITELFLAPKNRGVLLNADAVGEVGSVSCGEVIRVYIKVKDDVITSATFEAFGGAAAIACASVLTERIKGKTPDEALQWANTAELDNALEGLPPSRLKSAVFTCEALQAAVKSYYDKHGIGYDPLDFALGCSLCDGCGDE